MITGRNDTWFTVSEFAGMVGRSEKTVMNWRTEGRIQFVSLCGVPLVALSMVENLITGTVPDGARDGALALRMTNRVDASGRRAAQERHATRPGRKDNRHMDAGTSPAAVSASGALGAKARSTANGQERTDGCDQHAR